MALHVLLLVALGLLASGSVDEDFSNEIGSTDDVNANDVQAKKAAPERRSLMRSENKVVDEHSEMTGDEAEDGKPMHNKRHHSKATKAHHKHQKNHKAHGRHHGKTHKASKAGRKKKEALHNKAKRTGALHKAPTRKDVLAKPHKHEVDAHAAKPKPNLDAKAATPATTNTESKEAQLLEESPAESADQVTSFADTADIAEDRAREISGKFSAVALDSSSSSQGEAVEGLDKESASTSNELDLDQKSALADKLVRDLATLEELKAQQGPSPKGSPAQSPETFSDDGLKLLLRRHQHELQGGRHDERQEEEEDGYKHNDSYKHNDREHNDSYKHNDRDHNDRDHKDRERRRIATNTPT